MQDAVAHRDAGKAANLPLCLQDATQSFVGKIREVAAIPELRFVGIEPRRIIITVEKSKKALQTKGRRRGVAGAQRQHTTIGGRLDLLRSYPEVNGHMTIEARRGETKRVAAGMRADVLHQVRMSRHMLLPGAPTITQYMGKGRSRTVFSLHRRSQPLRSPVCTINRTPKTEKIGVGRQCEPATGRPCQAWHHACLILCVRPRLQSLGKGSYKLRREVAAL